MGKLNFEDLFSITQTADLGLSFEKDTCLSYRYSLPNKIFDYIHAEIPVLISDLPEFKNIIEEYNIGMILNSRDPKDVANQIKKLLSIDKTMWSSKISLAKQVLCWENEEKKLLSIFS
jgi:glycosyltransferase involved in cell wall biosynthesis